MIRRLLRVLPSARTVGRRPASRARSVPGVLVALFALLACAPAMAQSLTSGLSLDTMAGAPAAAWQSVDTRHSLVSQLSFAPTAPGCSGSIAGSHVLSRGRWLVSGDLAASSYDRLSASSGDLGLTFTPAALRAGMLQATVGMNFAGGNGVAWDGGLWPVANGSQRTLSAGLRWAPAALVSLHMSAQSVHAALPITEQEFGLDTAVTPGLLLSLGATAQQAGGAGLLTSAVVHWQPRPESALAFDFEADLARSFRSGPLPGEPFDSDASALSGERVTGQIASAAVEAPISDALLLRVGASLPVGSARAISPSWLVSVSHSL